MIRALPIAVAISAYATASIAESSPPPFQIALLQDYAVYDDRCRGGSGDASETFKACGARDYVGYMLGIIFLMCYGKRDQAGYQFAWHTCDLGSNLPVKQ